MWRLLRDSAGSWNTICILTQDRISLGERWVMSRPSKVMEPALGSNSLSNERPRVDLPHPDSPPGQGSPA